VSYLVTIEEIKKSVEGNSQWVKFGAKVDDPFLSIFSEQIKKDIAPIKYAPGKAYKFVDETHEYKILVTTEKGKKKFDFYIKPLGNIKKKYPNKILGIDGGVFIMGATAIFIGTTFIMLLPYLFW